MNRLLFISRAVALSFTIVLGALFAGCATHDPQPPAMDLASLTNAPNVESTRDVIRKGDKIKIDFFDAPGLPQAWEQVVREDGTIALPMNLVVAAEGKNKRALADEIHKIYVPKYYKRMTVNIKADDRYYYVDGEVKTPGLKPHPGEMTATKAIAAAGDFTDYASRTSIDIFRATGEKIHFNWKKAAKDPSRDVPVYPGDRVHVNRRF